MNTTRRTNRFTADASGGYAAQRAMDAREANRGLPLPLVSARPILGLKIHVWGRWVYPK